MTSRPFSSYSGKSAFGQVREPLDAGEHVLNKKAVASYCNVGRCVLGQSRRTSAELLLLEQAQRLKYTNQFNRANLYVNLYSQMDLSGVCPIVDLSGNCPTVIASTVTPSALNLDYVIDPSGVLFGNSTCGINNFTEFMTTTTTAPVYP
jgi:hypothetical protein